MKSINFKKYINFYYKKYTSFEFDFKFKKYKKNKFFLLYVAAFIFFTTTIYLSIPKFFDYEKLKSNVEDKIYSDFGLKSSIQGRIKYKVLPSPRIVIEKLVIKDFVNNKKNLGEVENTFLKIPLKRLFSLNKIDFNKIELKKAK